MLAIFYPAWTAGGDERQFPSALQPVQEFGAFFHNGEIRGEIRVKNLVEAQPPEAFHKLSHQRRAWWQTKFLADGGPDGGRYLHHHDFIRIRQSLPDLTRAVLLSESPCGADQDALSAEGAGNLS